MFRVSIFIAKSIKYFKMQQLYALRFIKKQNLNQKSRLFKF